MRFPYFIKKLNSKLDTLQKSVIPIQNETFSLTHQLQKWIRKFLYTLLN